LSPFHFHRMFSSWAGVTPKAFLKALTYAHARQRLTQGGSVLNAALESGLSGPGRLHDLCLTLEAVSPGEVKQMGRGLTIHYGFAKSPFGLCMIGGNDRGICRICFVDEKEQTEAVAALIKDWPKAQLLESHDFAVKQVGRIFRYPSRAKSRKSDYTLRMWVNGTEFQLMVWHALLRIPSGHWMGYQQLAESVGRPQASRAIGNAVGANPIAYLIPCHRVIRSCGAIGGYRWGIQRKRAMMALESSRNESDEE
ncbi:MAG TPA: methylated-DNA--[protein]-cysteine S-methyltransferase, partial [Verrucomicrobia bacterium]|nr:methylated-DNA--[protein]-cysteine S-methyltransferase [Verrucomicrobiota bacterium]